MRLRKGLASSRVTGALNVMVAATTLQDRRGTIVVHGMLVDLGGARLSGIIVAHGMAVGREQAGSTAIATTNARRHRRANPRPTARWQKPGPRR